MTNKQVKGAALAALLLTTGCVHMAAEIATNRYHALPPGDAAAPTATVAVQDAAWCATHDCSASAEVLQKPVNVLFDPHAHLNMKPGMGFLFKGDPEHLEHEPLWSDPFSEKMAIERIRTSGFGLIVVCLYANAMITWPGDVSDAVYEEIRLTSELVGRHPELFEIATTSGQARRIIASGKIALVFALEGGEWAMRDERAVAELYRAGVRMTNPVHIYDSWIGGSDLQEGAKIILNPPGWANSTVRNGRRENRRGLAEEGKKLLVSLINYGYIIDVSHMSRQSLRDFDDLTAQEKVPYLNSHVPNLSSSAISERSANDEMLRLLRNRGGLLGLVPASYAPQNPVGAPELCQGTVDTYARLFSEATRKAEGMPIAFSSDFNGGVSHVRPTHGPDGCRALDEAKTDFERKGLADIGYVPELIAAMRDRGVDVSPMYAASERFLQIWERAEALKKK